MHYQGQNFYDVQGFLRQGAHQTHHFNQNQGSYTARDSYRQGAAPQTHHSNQNQDLYTAEGSFKQVAHQNQTSFPVEGGYKQVAYQTHHFNQNQGSYTARDSFRQGAAPQTNYSNQTISTKNLTDRSYRDSSYLLSSHSVSSPFDEKSNSKSKTIRSHREQPDQQLSQKTTKIQEKPKSILSLWRDPAFPPLQKSIFGKILGQETPQTLQGFQNAEWKSIAQSHQLFLYKIEYKDIIQTVLGDCYLVAFLSGLAEKEGRIRKLLHMKEYPKGAYGLTCYYMGEEETLQLDSYFPFIAGGKTLAETNGNESWVLFLEKGFAKKFGSYAAIEGGISTEAMRFYTGAPAEVFWTSKIKYDGIEEDRLWNMLVNHRSDYIFTCGIAFLTQERKALGLIGSHAYTILNAFEVKNDNENLENDRVLVIRNPWGRRNKDGNGEYKGKLSDEFLKKNAKYRGKLPYNYEGKDDGVFHISYDDFLEYFESAEACYLHSKFILRSERRTITGVEKETFRITVKTQKTSFFIMVNQECKRMFSQYSGFEYSEISFNVYDSTNQKIYNNDTIGKDQQVWKKVSLRPGNYKVSVRVKLSNFALLALQHKIKPEINSVVLNTYGPENVELGNSTLLSPPY